MKISNLDFNLDEEQIIALPGENGEDVEYDVVLTFDCEETGKHYIVFTDNTYDSAGNTKVFVNTYEDNDEDVELFNVETEEEWDMVSEAMRLFREAQDAEEE